jgi:two-component system sensor histidine kinase ChvG
MVSETEHRIAPHFGARDGPEARLSRVAPEARLSRVAPEARLSRDVSPAALDEVHAAPPPRRRWLPSLLTVRILALNIPALGILLGGALFLGQYRDGLVEAKIKSLRAEGAIIAAALGESAAPLDGTGFDRELARQLVRRLAATGASRARLFDSDYFLVADSQGLGQAALAVRAQNLPEPGREPWIDRVAGGIDAWILRASLSPERLPPYRENAVQLATDYSEVTRALSGEVGTALRQLSDGEMLVSVAIPVQRFKFVLGALMLTVEGGDIEEKVRDVRVSILQVFGLALAVTVLMSIYLAGAIARPIQILAAAALRARVRSGRRTDIPDLTGRKDEIGELSGALREMTDTLYGRMDAIEAFAADVAHEIRNPLSSIRSAVELLPRTEDAERRSKLIGIIYADVRRLERLIKDISDASRLGAELARAETNTVDLVLIVRTLVEVLGETQATADAGVTFAIDADGPVRVRCVEDHIGQVLRNLLANAISFSPRGGAIRITLKRTQREAEVSVEDDGPGVPPDKLEAVFDRFYSLRPQGEPFGMHSGLGLSISKQIVEAHGGHLWAENRVGSAKGVKSIRGARFVFTLPIG